MAVTLRNIINWYNEPPKQSPLTMAVLKHCEEEPDLCSPPTKGQEEKGAVSVTSSAGSSPSAGHAGASPAVVTTPNFAIGSKGSELGDNTKLTGIVPAPTGFSINLDGPRLALPSTRYATDIKMLPDNQERVRASYRGAIQDLKEAATQLALNPDPKNDQKIQKDLAVATNRFVEARQKIVIGDEQPVKKEDAESAAKLWINNAVEAAQKLAKSPVRQREAVETTPVAVAPSAASPMPPAKSVKQELRRIKPDDGLFAIAGQDESLLAAARQAVGTKVSDRTVQVVATVALAAKNPQAVGPTINDLVVGAQLQEPSKADVAKAAADLHKKLARGYLNYTEVADVPVAALVPNTASATKVAAK